MTIDKKSNIKNGLYGVLIYLILVAIIATVYFSYEPDQTPNTANNVKQLVTLFTKTNDTTFHNMYFVNDNKYYKVSSNDTISIKLEITRSEYEKITN
jgi:uncharacterized protein (UPF0333 family)